MTLDLVDEPMSGKTYAFDLDGTLCTNTQGDYENAAPFPKRISHVNHLRELGNVILIFTARGATSGRDLRELTEGQLRKWGVKYDRLVLGKPHFDVLIDDKAVSSAAYFDDE